MKEKHIKVLFLDFGIFDGHVCFNNTWIKTLLSYPELDLTFCANDDYLNKFTAFNPYLTKIPIPNSYYKKRGKFSWVISDFFTILWAHKHLNLESYDYVIVSSHNTVSFFLGTFFQKKRLYLICHNNLSKLNNPLYQHMIRHIGKKNYYIVFEDYIKKNLSQYVSSNRIFVIHLGCPLPFNAIPSNQIPEWIIKLKKNKIIFSPSRNATDEFLKSIQENNSFCNYLSKSNIVLAAKGNLSSNHSNIIYIDKRLSNIEYQSLFQLSDIILLPYPSSYINRVSAVLFEAISNNKTIICSDLPGLKSYKTIYSKIFFYSSINDLANTVEIALNESQTDLIKLPKEYLQPDIRTIFV